MRRTLPCRRRLILGMSIEDAQSKFDSPESRIALRLAHERHNQGIYHELHLAQRQRNRLPAERRCHLVRHTKPTVKGFQAYMKSSSEDYVVREIWRVDEEIESTAADTLAATLEDGNPESRGDSHTAALAAPTGTDAVGPMQTPSPGEAHACEEDSQREAHTASHAQSERGELKNDQRTLTMGTKKSSSHMEVPRYVGDGVAEEFDTFMKHRSTVMEELTRLSKTLGEEVRERLVEQRESGTLLSLGQSSVVDRLVDKAKDAKDKGYTSLSSSSHLLESLTLKKSICGKKDKHLIEAFRSRLLGFPAVEGHVSLSLWVSGQLIEDDDLAVEFPHHIVKHAEMEMGEDGLPLPTSRVPKVRLEVYFSTELYQLQQTIGVDGVIALRRFIGRTMRHQHDPLPTTPSILLSMSITQQEAYGFGPGDAIRIPWPHSTRAKVAVTTGTVLQATEEAPQVTAMRTAVQLVWRTWGHLVKDLHVYGDLDYLYIAVVPHLERREKPLKGSDEFEETFLNHKKDHTNSHDIPTMEQEKAKEEPQLLQDMNKKKKKKSANDISPPIRNIADTVDGLIGSNNAIWKGFKQRKSQIKPVLVPADFVVLECLLEKKGLPHRLVVEDIVESLTDLQLQSMEMQRLAIVESLDTVEEITEGVSVRPVLYAPKVSISHAGVIDAVAHSFQRIRIRGSCVAHVEALARALHSGAHFTERGEAPVAPPQLLLQSPNAKLPPNLTFTATRSEVHRHAMDRRLVGHQVPSSYVVQRGANGRLRAEQTLRSLEHTITDREEREFWREHYYRLSDVRVIFHDRVVAEDGTNVSQWSQRLKDQLLSISQQQEHMRGTRQSLNPQQQQQQQGDGEEGADVITEGTPKKGGKKTKKRTKRAMTVALEDFVATLSPEKIFEYLCVDMEVESASYDFRVGDNDGYAYRVKLRRIPQAQLPLVESAVQSLQEKGFINYFGPQRFASYTKHNMHPGLHLLKGEFRAAASIIVQQFHLDTAIAAERRRSGSAVILPKMYHSKGAGYRLPDFTRTHGGRTIMEHGTAMQAILDNALQAAVALDGEATAARSYNEDYDMASPGPHEEEDAEYDIDEEDGHTNRKGKKKKKKKAAAASVTRSRRGDTSLTSPSSSSSSSFSHIYEDPCAEAFLRVIGPHACGMLVHEFLAFVWNDIVNQRLQRYGTFAILPGDLVRSNPFASPHSPEFGHLTYTSKRDIEKGKYTFWDVVLPIPGAGVQLPDNHTTDLYIVTLQRMGILFNPETRQWDVFRAQRGGGDAPLLSHTLSPYRRFLSSSSSALVEEELVSRTPVMDPPEDDATGARAEDSVGMLRLDLRPGTAPGNPLGITIHGFHRHVLVKPTPTLRWRVRVGHGSDPHQRWALGVRRAFTERVHGTNDRKRGDGIFANGTAPRRGRGVPASPPVPYWLPPKRDGCLDLVFELPSSVYPSMLLRELTKSDVNSPEVVDLDRPLQDTRAKSWNDLAEHQQATYKRFLAQKRQKLFATRPRALSIALLHQHIFRSDGMRRSLLPSMRGYDNVSK